VTLPFQENLSLKPTWKETSLVIVVGLIQTVAIVCIARGLISLITFCTGFFYYGRLSFEEAVPDPHRLGLISIGVPVIGGLVVGLMARYGSRGIRGHGIPEAMESILIRESRIAKRLTILKPLSSAVAIGSGGPFGAEGPIIATGGAVGSLLGQALPVHESSRKILLASGAAAGMTAIFGTPLSAVLLCIELLLFEFKAGSFIPVARCAALAHILRDSFFGWNEPFFQMRPFTPPSTESFFIFLAFGVALGVLSTFIIKSVFWIEDQFEKLPVHWMLWPALGGLVVGIIGWIEPRSLSVGYNNITDALMTNMSLTVAASILIFKFLSWSIALGSGTSGGTLAPLMTLGATFGLLTSALLSYFAPSHAIDPQVFALVGMAGLFAGCSRSMLASVLFAFEATKQPLGIVPLLGTCSMAYLVSRSMCVDSIMTLKIVRRGVRVPHEYVPAPLETPRVSAQEIKTPAPPAV
jgi:H+/Cl- antiporter ClcA